MKELVGKEIIIEPNKVYLIVSEDDEANLEFQLLDSCDYTSGAESISLAVIARGMIEQVLTCCEDVMEAGLKAFVKEGMLVKKDEKGLSLDFPEPAGSA